MLKFSWTKFSQVAVLVGGGLVAATAGSSAMTLPVPSQPVVNAQVHTDGQVLQVAKRYKKRHHSYRRYDRHRDGRRYRHRHHGYRYHYRGYWYSRPWWSLSFGVPLAIPSYSGSAHVRYCENKYRSYNPSTDLYLGYDGRYHHCVAPY